MTSARIGSVNLSTVDPTELDKLERVCAAMPPTSTVAAAVRDVLQAIEWGISRYAGPNPRVEITVTRGDDN